jgi:hypothetical protein
MSVFKRAAVMMGCLAVFFMTACLSVSDGIEIDASSQKGLSLEQRVKKSFDDNWKRIKEEKWDEIVFAEGEEDGELIIFKMTVEKVTEELGIDHTTVFNFIKEKDYVKPRKKKLKKTIEGNVIKWNPTKDRIPEDMKKKDDIKDAEK